jgi:hypothetical protein
VLSDVTSAFVVAAETHEVSHAVHMDAVLYGVVVFAVLMLAMVVSMSFKNVANRHPETPARMDPHRQVHSRDSSR